MSLELQNRHQYSRQGPVYNLNVVRPVRTGLSSSLFLFRTKWSSSHTTPDEEGGEGSNNQGLIGNGTQRFRSTGQKEEAYD